MGRRQKTYIDFEVQTMIVRRLSMHWLLFVIANLIAILCWLALFEVPIHDASTFWGTCGDRLLPVVLVSTAILPVFIYDALKLSNRFTGPIARVKRTLAQMSQGEKPKAIEFRDSDCWQSLAHDLNKALNLAPQPAQPSDTRESPSTQWS